ncbi:hypothetical protein [Mucilaginibacter ginsenosidivorans]|uniref:Universal stress protein n=1 Tax=Mucilaginibacter ginsenosidivorans TaxID=398053 RepID=A0A5B8UY66_9SPHI|nr:hypothetical protein [Mucilaginibacter ginsenosidivorans]QEC64050.1 hypothetical protein FRZ54_16190 [Mucilaginibacter ginsenosidivorans]
MGNILIINNSVLNTWGFAKLATTISRQFKYDITIYCRTPALCVPALALGAGDEPVDDMSTLEEKLEQFNTNSTGAGLAISPEGGIGARNISDLLIAQNIKLIIMSKEDDMLMNLSPNERLAFVNKLTCPVLLLPEGHYEYPDKVVYLTDLRYCTLDALRFLKHFGCSIYVAHMTLPGMTDMEERYAQETLADFAGRLNYNKMFLRNIRGKAKEYALEMITSQVGINCVVVESKKHLPLENFLPGLCERSRNYDRAALLVLPYLNWRR